MRLFITTIAAVLLATATSAGAQDDAAQTNAISSEVMSKCPYPSKEDVVIPNGRNATEQEMIDAQGTVKGFVSAGDEYLACLDGVKTGWGEEVTEEQHAVIAIFHNRMVDDMQSVADLFNSALNAYRSSR